MGKIEVEIKEIANGWLVDDSYYGEETFFTNYNDASMFAKKIFSRYKKDEYIEKES